MLSELVPEDVFNDDYIYGIKQVYTEIYPNVNKSTIDTLNNLNNIFIHDYIRMINHDNRLPEEVKLFNQIKKLDKENRSVF